MDSRHPQVSATAARRCSLDLAPSVANRFDAELSLDLSPSCRYAFTELGMPRFWTLQYHFGKGEQIETDDAG